SIFFTGAFGMILTIWGMCGFLFGGAVTRRLAFPAFVLCFMVPPALQMIHDVGLDLKLFATAAAIRVIDLMGITVVNDGSTILMEGAVVNVGNACSGLRSLISLIFLGVLF